MYVGAYWDKEDIATICTCLLSGATFCMVEALTSFGTKWFGDVMPHSILRARIEERRKQCAVACRRYRANFLFIPRGMTVVESLHGQLIRGATLH